MEMVKKLREATGAGVMDCKKALEATSGDYERAVEFLRLKGIASAAKREDREAKEGLIAIVVQSGKGAIAQLNCETDFVARTDDFKALAEDLAKKVLVSGEAVVNSDETQNRVKELSGKVGEKMALSRASLLDSQGGFISSYLHSNKKIGVIVAFEGKETGEDVAQCGKDVAMQIAAAKAMFVSPKDIPAEIIDRQKEYFRQEVANKPPQIQEKIIQGKLDKWFEDACLTEQKFIKNEGQKVKDYVTEVGKKSAQTLTIRRFIRLQLGG